METISWLFKVLWAPRETLLLVSKKPRLIAPLIFVTLFTVAEAATLFVRVDSGQLRLEQYQREGIADKVSPEDQLVLMTAAREQQRIALISAAVRPLIVTALAAAVFFGCLSIFGRTAGFKPIFSITAFCFIPLAIRSLLSIVTLIALSPSARLLELAGSLSPAVFIDPQSVSRITYVAIGLIDLISMWILALLVIGFGFVSAPHLKTGHRVAIVLTIWLVYVALRLGFAGAANI